ncbi:MAG TPA: hypothetical protein VFN04_06985, partial [Protaetiibacter sp.]|nr:hypothetical protein [Protaetiibacter sp.]
NAVGIRYEHRGRNLGGLAGNVDFIESIDEMAQRARDGERLVLVCSEGDWRKCHRHEDLTPPLLERGIEVAHIEWSQKVVVLGGEQKGAMPGPAAIEPLFDWPTERTRRAPGFVAP